MFEDIAFINFNDCTDVYNLMFKWCSNPFVYEWFEQRELSYEEIVDKYSNKLKNNKQHLLIINYLDEPIGYIQIYKCEDKLEELDGYNNLYEYDVFIGEDKYLSKGLGTKIIGMLNDYIKDNYLADGIVLRPFKRNERAVKCYLKSGFKIIKEYEDIDTLGNKETYLLLINMLK